MMTPTEKQIETQREFCTWLGGNPDMDRAISYACGIVPGGPVELVFLRRINEMTARRILNELRDLRVKTGGANPAEKREATV